MNTETGRAVFGYYKSIKPSKIHVKLHWLRWLDHVRYIYRKILRLRQVEGVRF